MKSVARSYFWWPSLDANIVAMCATCSICQEQASTPAREPFPPWVFPSKPFERVHVDFAEYNHRFYFLLVDAYSKWLEVFDMGRDSTTSRTVSCLGDVISPVGVPQIIVSDNGRQFTSSEFESFCAQNGIQHKRSPPYHSASYGQVERIARELKKLYVRSSLMYQSPPSYTASCFRIATPRIHPQEKLRLKLLFSYCPTIRLSFLQPSFTCSMQKHQASDVAPRRGFSAGDLVWCLNQQHRGNNKWLKGGIRTCIGPLTYAVSCYGRLCHMHVEHLRSCKIAAAPEFSSSSDQPSEQPIVLSRSSDSPLSQP